MACSFSISPCFSDVCAWIFPENTSAIPSMACRYHVLITVWCTPCSITCSAIVASPRMASKATFALNSALDFFRLPATLSVLVLVAGKLRRPVRGSFWTEGSEHDSLNLSKGLKCVMSRRRIGQESFGFAADRRGAHSSLDDLAGLIDWAPVGGAVSGISSAAKGEPAWPPLALFKAMLLSVWHDLSDVRLAEALDDRASFRRFCGFSSCEPTPERTAFVRFRKALVARELDKVLFETITAQLKAKAIRVKTGTLVDATIIASASEGDGEARWVKHKGRPAVHGFKAHVGADADTALVEEIAVTPANVNDGKAGPGALPDEPGEVFADSAYRGRHFQEAVRARGGVPRIAATGMWGRDEAETLARLAAWNRPIHQIRARIEKIFGTWKRSYGLRRMRWRGLAKAACQIRLTAIAYNLRRGLTLRMAA